MIGKIAEPGLAKRRKSKQDGMQAAPGSGPEEPRPGEYAAADQIARDIAAVALLIRGTDFASVTRPLVYLVSRNRQAAAEVWRSGVAVKADAARKLFNIDCSNIVWAIVDSGVDAKHPTFRRRNAREQSPSKEIGSETEQAALH